MEVLDPGHNYLLDNYGNAGSLIKLKFVKKKKNEENGDFYLVHNGTTNEEVIKVLIDRLTYLQEKLPCAENPIAIANLEGALNILTLRTRDREDRNVEGTNKP